MSYSYSLSELLLNHDPLDNIYYYTAHFWPSKDCNIIVGNFPTSNFSIVDVILKSSSFWEIHFWRNYSNGSLSKFLILDFFPNEDTFLDGRREILFEEILKVITKVCNNVCKFSALVGERRPFASRCLAQTSVRSGIRACNGRDTFRIAVNAGQLNVSSERRNNSGLAYGHSFILVYCQLRGNKHRWNTQRRAINLPVALPSRA